eukprot:337463-Amphidinium_carterae.1
MTEEDFQQHYHKKVPESGLFDNRLLVACSTHVDDIKAVGRPLVLDLVVKQLEEKVGKLTREKSSFIHTGIQHEQTAT